MTPKQRAALIEELGLEADPKDKAFPLRLAGSSWPSGPVTVCDGVAGLGFRVRTFYVGVGQSTAPLQPFTRPASPPGGGAPSCVFRLVGLHHGGSYVRDFALGQGDQVEVDVSGFRDVRLILSRANLPTSGNPITPYGVATSREVAGRERPHVIYPLRIGGAGTYRVPYGATHLYPGTADAGFAWSTQDAAGTVVSVPAATTAGVAQSVSGSWYTTSGGFSGVWRIQL